MNSEMVKVQAEKAGKVPLTQVIEEGTVKMQRVVERLMDIFGSSGKA